MYVRFSVYPHGTAQLPRKDFCEIAYFEFLLKLIATFQFWLKSKKTKKQGPFALRFACIYIAGRYYFA
jgi:hypothetical protein